MMNKSISQTPSTIIIWTAKLSILFATVSLVALLGLHFLSPEFDPSWRMVSEYANGKFEWLLIIFFISWGISSWNVAIFLWSYIKSPAGKAGVILLFISGAGEIMAAFCNVNHPLHGTAGTLGIPTFVIASLLISWQLRKNTDWSKKKKSLLWSAHATWISLLLVIVTMIVMIIGFKNAGIAIGPDQKPPAEVPNGVTALVGYANRILIIAFIGWLLLVSNNYLRIVKPKAVLVHSNL